jgi:hypothetical protein
MTRCCTLLLALFLCTCVRAQTLTGTVTDAQTGEPLPFASIYVEKTKSGTASNAEGQYQLRLSGGANRIIFQFLGYQAVVKTAYPSTGRLDVALQPEALDLQQVEILSSGEDLSYSVIRRAIAKADYHRNQIERYDAEVYIKGTGKVNKIPGLLRMMAPKEDREEIDAFVGRPFTTESTSKITYERPNTFKQDVVSVYQIGEETFDAAPYVFASFYEPLIADEIVSPLSPKSFGYYRFEHEGVFVDQEELINKIKVIPRSRGEDVFEGYVYIVQDDWSLHSLDLTTYKLGFQIDVAQNFAEVQEHIWMPITTKMDAEGQIIGVAFEYHYLSTVSNYNLELNEELGGYVEVIDEKTQPDLAKSTKRENQVAGYERTLAEGGELTRKELRRLMREYEKQERQESDEPEVVSNYTLTNDSAKAVIDTAYWAANRPVPLTAEERRGYAIADSIQRLERPEQGLVKVEINGGDANLPDSTAVDTSRVRRKRTRWRNQFLPDAFFNPVEGYTLGGRFGVANKNKFGFGVRSRYGIAWDRLSWELDSWIGRSGQGSEKRFRFSGGRNLRQFNDQPAIDPWISTFTNLFDGNNFIRLYESAYGRFDYRRNYGEAWRAEFSLEYEDRRAVSNNAENQWFSKDEEPYTPNTPINAERGIVGTVSPAATVNFRLAWRPGLDYQVVNGNKEVIELSAPTVSLGLRAGIPEIGNSTADFTQLEAAYEHRFAMGRKGFVDLLVRGGAFLNNTSVDFPDFKHFATSEITLTSLDPIGSYRLLPYYLNSTQEEYLEFYGHYQFRKFLLSRIWKLHLMGLKEDLFVNYLYTPFSENYTELGYSIDNILRVFRLEFVTSFRDFQYEDFGVRLSVSTTFSRL